ncbi:MAG: macrolide ABC transporter ATP-binding protein [Myxococcales bacterium]|nr:macrolide ABC transporter ATP-binding protein [Myxococcales bacterium]
MIEVSGVTRYYGSGRVRHTALRDVTLSIGEGEFVSIVGTSGSGKTTLLNVLGGLDRGWEGSVKVDGREMRALSDRELSALRNTSLGFVFQHFNLLDHLTCQENVTLSSFFGSPVKDPAARADELLRKVGLGDKITARPSELSGGQKQRVAIARALFPGPKLILCDEPTGSLDYKTGMQILELFQDLNATEGITVIVVTHEDHVAKVARRRIRLEDGVVVEDEREG